MSLIRWAGYVEDEDEEPRPRRVQRWKPYLWSVCHPQCFYAEREEKCDCKCGGKYHGVGRRSVSEEEGGKVEDKGLLGQKSERARSMQKKIVSRGNTLDHYAMR
ncbi:MAG: hypothetical protein QXI64_10255 [Sulfolobales archaeon]